MKILLIIGILGLLILIGCDKENEEQLLCVDEECSNLVAGNFTFMIGNITTMFTIDCSLPGDYSVGVVYGDIIGDSNLIEIPFIEFCERLKPQANIKYDNLMNEYNRLQKELLIELNKDCEWNRR